MTVRQWSDHLFAAYLPGGLFGEFVDTAPTREEAEILVAQALRARDDASNRRRITTPPGESVAASPDDLNPTPDRAGSEAPA